MSGFETKLIHDILCYLPITEIGKICSSLMSFPYQQLCKDDILWKRLLVRDYGVQEGEDSISYLYLYQRFHQLYRDYGIFSPILDELKTNLSSSKLYQEFYSNPLYNSVEFRDIYFIMSKYLEKIEFYDEHRNITLIPTILRKPYTPFVQINFQFDLVFTDKSELIIEELEKQGYQVSFVYGGLGNPPLYMTLSGKMDKNNITFKIPVMDHEIALSFQKALNEIRGQN